VWDRTTDALRIVSRGSIRRQIRRRSRTLTVLVSIVARNARRAAVAPDRRGPPPLIVAHAARIGAGRASARARRYFTAIWKLD